MIRPVSKFISGALAPLAAIVLIAALAIPAVANAQNPAVDQYAPTAPDGGGSVPAPVPSSEEGTVGNSGDDTSAGPSDSGSGGGEDAAAAPTTPADEGSAAPAAPVDTDAGADEGQGNGDKRTLDGLAANASEQREEASAVRTDSAATELLRSESGGDLGMGVFLWVVLGVTALWALAVLARARHDRAETA